MKYEFIIDDDFYKLVLPNGDILDLDEHQGCALSSVIDVFLYSTHVLTKE